MGGGHSRELELAQQQVARLTKDLKKVSTELVFRESALAAAIKKAPVPQADEQLKRQLAAAEAEATQAKQLARDAPFLREQLQRAQRSGDEKLQGAQSELLAAKRELERVTGELKFAHQEQRTLGRLQADLSTAQRELCAALLVRPKAPPEALRDGLVPVVEEAAVSYTHLTLPTKA